MTEFKKAWQGHGKRTMPFQGLFLCILYITTSWSNKSHL